MSVNKRIILFVKKSNAFLFVLLLCNVITIYAQQPNGCTNPPAPYTNVGGDFEFIPSNGVSNPTDNYCIDFGLTDITVSLVQKTDPNLGVTFPNNTLFYAFDVKNTLTTGSFGTISTQTINASGDYWFAQVGTVGAKSYIKCKKLKIHKIEPVTVSIKTCGAATVTVTIPSKTQNPKNNHDKYAINWNDGSPIQYEKATNSTLVITRNYTPTNPIIVFGQYLDDSGNVICKSPDVFNNVSSNNNIYISELTTLANKTDFQLTFKNFVPLTNYKVSYALDNGTYNWKQDPNNHINGSALLKGLSATDNYCFMIEYQDVCGVSQPSNTVCSMKLKDNLVSSSEVKLDWNLPTLPSGVLQKNEVVREITNCNSANCNKVLPPVTPAGTTTSDKTIVCSNSYNYTANTTFFYKFGDNNITVSVNSNTVTLDPSSGGGIPPAPSSLLAVSYTDKKEIRLNTLEVDYKPKYSFYRAVGNSQNFELIGTSTTNSYVDASIDPNVDFYCYKYEYTDKCGKVSALSDSYCSIHLYQNTSSPSILSWTKTSDPNNKIVSNPTYILYYINNGVNNQVVQTDKLESDIQSIIDLYPGKPEYQFVLIASIEYDAGVGPNFTASLISNVITVVIPSSLQFPTAFTPNGANPNFKVETNFNVEGKMMIYDRWGSLVFETDDIVTGWNGTDSKGKEMPIGTYIYKVKAIDKDNIEFFKTSTVTLLR